MTEDKEEKITLEFIARRLENIQAEQRNLRKDFRDQTALILQVAEHSRRLSGQMTELRDETPFASGSRPSKQRSLRVSACSAVSTDNCA